MTFQASDLKSNHFLDLLDDECCTIEPSYTKGGPWIRYFSHSNMLCARVTQVITNYAPIGEYWLRFFPKEEFSCLYGYYPIKTRHYILYDCRRFNKYWNPMRDTLSQLVAFLEFNLEAFSFYEGIT